MADTATSLYIGRRIQALREGLRMSRKELAEKLEMTPQMIWLYEQGKTDPPSSRVVQFAEIFGVAPGDFYPTPEEPAAHVG